MKAMTKGILCLSLCLLALACTRDKHYTINGFWEGGEGKVVYLMREVGLWQYETLDMTFVADKWVIASGENKKEIILTEEPLNVKISSYFKGEGGKRKEYTRIEVDTTLEQKVLEEGNNISLGKSLLELGYMMFLTEAGQDSVAVDSVTRNTQMMREKLDRQLRTLLDTNCDTYASLFVIKKVILPKASIDTTEYYYNRLTERVKNSYAGQQLQKQIKGMYDVMVGGIAPEIELPDQKGIYHKLSSLRGKYVLLDFWASWCAPCMAEMSNLKEIYDQYHGKGLEIFGVSLDRKVEDWMKAIADKEMKWIQVCSQKGWSCAAAERYRVTGIPRMFLLDPAGKIIAVDLRGEELKEKIASLFNPEIQ